MPDDLSGEYAIIKYRHIEPVDPGMVIPVAGELVPPSRNATDHLWMTLCNPSQHKESGADRVRRKQFEQTIDVRLHTTRDFVPCRTWYLLFKGLNLEIIFNIDRHRIGSRTASAASRCRWAIH